MHILITGGTGFIGSALCKQFKDLGFRVSIITRKLTNKTKLDQSIDFITNLNNINQYYDVIINLAGEPLNKRRWNEEVKQEIYNSRINTTKEIINYIEKSQVKTKLLISGSAIGYYGNDADKTFTENSTPGDTGFTHKLCNDWEQTALQAIQYGVRVCLIRTGIVLGKNGGALKELMTPFKFGLGAILGNGKQWMPWIHIQDMIEAIMFLINNDNLNGAFNLTAPTPVTNKEFSKQLAKSLERPCFLRLPNMVVKIMFGEMGETLLLNGQKVIPDKLIKSGYKFKFQDLDSALENLIT